MNLRLECLKCQTCTNLYHRQNTNKPLNKKKTERENNLNANQIMLSDVLDTHFLKETLFLT